MWITSLVSAVVLTQAPMDPFACDLAPSLGQGSADEGPIDNHTTVSLACRYQLFQVAGIGISPVIGIDRQMWSVYESDSQTKNIYSYQTQDYFLGARFDRRMTDQTKWFYTIAGGLGTGKLDSNQSNTQTSVQGDYNGLTQTMLSHTLGASYKLTEKLDLSLAYQRTDASQSWKARGSDILVQSVDESNALTLTDGNSTTALTESPRTKNKTSTNAIQVGLSLSFGG